MEQLSNSKAPSRPREIRQHNAITTARYDYTACQMDIMFFLLSVLGKEDAPDKVYTLYLKDMEAISGHQWNYQQLQEATADLGSRMFLVSGEKEVEQLWMMDSVKYKLGEGHVVIALTQSVRPYLFDLKNNFTTYGLTYALKLSSKYSKRIYQLVSQWKDKESTCTYTLHDFKVMLSLKDPISKKGPKGKKDPDGKSEELFKNISQLKLRVLDVAIRQISEHTELEIEYELLKKGRAFDRIRFSIAHKKTPQPQPLTILGQQPSTDTRQVRARQQLDNLGIIDPKLVAQIMEDSKLVDELFKFTFALKTGTVKAHKNPGGLFLKKCGLR